MIFELCPGDLAHMFTRGLVLAHLDAALRGDEAAGDFLDHQATAALAAPGVPADRA